MKKILIGGGSGTIGSYLTEYLISRHFDVFVLSRTPEKVRNSNAIYWNPALMEIDKASLPSADGIINLCGAGIADARWTKRRKLMLRESRVQSNILLSRVIDTAANPQSVFICASAIGYYGDRGEETITESSAPGSPGFLVNLSRDWESSTGRIRETGLRTIILRMGVVLTHRGGMMSRMLLSRKFGLVPFFGNGFQYFSWVHMDDLCRIFHFFLENENASGIYNGVTNHPVIFREFARSLADTGKRFSISLGIPGFLLRLIFGEMSTAILMGSKVLPACLNEDGFTFRFEEIGQALQNLEGTRR